MNWSVFNACISLYSRNSTTLTRKVGLAINIAVIAKTLQTIADLMEVEDANPFKVRAMRQAADRVAAASQPFTDVQQLTKAVPGIGPAISVIISNIVSAGADAAIQKSGISIPISIHELLDIRGIGPATARTLYRQHGIASLEDLRSAVASGALQHLSGFGPRRMALLKREIEAALRRRTHIPIALAWPVATRMSSVFNSIPGVRASQVTGQCRRLVVEPTRIECIVSVDDVKPLRAWLAERSSEPGLFEDDETRQFSRDHVRDTPLPEHADIHVDVGTRRLPVRVYTASPRSYAYRLMQTTGDETHQQIVESLARERGLVWKAEGVFNSDNAFIRCDTEEEIYDLLGLPHYPPEVREGRGVLCDPARLVKAADMLCDLHVHSSWSDGTLSIRMMVAAAKAMGYQYIAITDHSHGLNIAGGLSSDDLLRQHEEIQEINEEQTGFTVLHGIEVDIHSDGSLDLPDEALWDLDIVIASVHSNMTQSRSDMTRRLLSAIEHPAVDIIGHPTGRIIGRREAYDLDLEKIVEAAGRHGVCLELNANPNRLDLTDEHLRMAANEKVRIAINTDAHSREELHNMEYGIRMARRGWLRTEHVINALPLTDMLSLLHKARR